MIRVTFPHRRLIVDRDRERQLRFLHFLADESNVLFGIGFRRMNGNNDDTLILEILPDTLAPRVIANAIDSPKSDEMNNDHFVFQIRNIESRTGVKPLGDVREFRHFLPIRDLDGQPRLGIFWVLRATGHNVEKQGEEKDTR